MSEARCLPHGASTPLENTAYKQGSVDTKAERRCEKTLVAIAWSSVEGLAVKKRKKETPDHAFLSVRVDFFLDIPFRHKGKQAGKGSLWW